MHGAAPQPHRCADDIYGMTGVAATKKKGRGLPPPSAEARGACWLVSLDARYLSTRHFVARRRNLKSSGIHERGGEGGPRDGSTLQFMCAACVPACVRAIVHALYSRRARGRLPERPPVLKLSLTSASVLRYSFWFVKSSWSLLALAFDRFQESKRGDVPRVVVTT